ncbi:hypothetical protein BKA23_2651 [Rudaeicoccus suwonensis]|uniref:Uncharacterized protein n=1 Tax=Rudaeicoccus suwonensis TaxID=657409 RepID=A0A561E3V2_9MICO|nr:hypothetical protein BKA23_2651 [Rudaeicoccus suwonensis]
MTVPTAVEIDAVCHPVIVVAAPLIPTMARVGERYPAAVVVAGT